MPKHVLNCKSYDIQIWMSRDCLNLGTGPLEPSHEPSAQLFRRTNINWIDVIDATNTNRRRRCTISKMQREKRHMRKGASASRSRPLPRRCSRDWWAPWWWCSCANFLELLFLLLPLLRLREFLLMFRLMATTMTSIMPRTEQRAVV